MVTLDVMTVKFDKGNVMYALRGMQENWVSLTISYILIMTSGSYCELNFCTFIHTPLYLLGT